MFPVLWLGLSACRVVDAPQALEDLAVFGFVHFDDGDAFTEATVAGLSARIDENAEPLLEGYRVGELSTEDLATAGIDVGEIEAIGGIAVTIPQRSEVDDLIGIITSDTIAADFTTTLEYDVLTSTDRDCFLSHACDSYTFEAFRVNDVGILGTSEQTFTMTVRWVALPDGRVGALARQLVVDPTTLSSGLARIDQNFILDFYEPLPTGGSRRFQANWIAYALLGLDLPDGIALDLAVNALRNRGEEMDTLIESRQ
ncbi:MAG: hypothetical protein R3F61_08880 [Myxococcota bacterium]